MESILVFFAVALMFAYFAYTIFWKSKSLFSILIKKDADESEKQHERSIGWVSWLVALAALLCALIVNFAH